jgi:hypothetical protein
MAKRDHQTKATTPRVLTEADFESPADGGLHHKTREKMLRTGEAVLPPDFDLIIERVLEELGPRRPRADGVDWNPQRRRPTKVLIS